MSQQTLLTDHFKSDKPGSDVIAVKRNKMKKFNLSLKRKPACDTDDIIIIDSEDDSYESITNTPNSSTDTILYNLETPTKERSCTSTPICASSPYSSPSKRTKFFSPIKKRIVHIKSPHSISGSPSRKQSAVHRQLFKCTQDDEFQQACIGIDDKTKFQLMIIDAYLKNESLTKLMDDRCNSLLRNYFKIPKAGMKLVYKLFWYKEAWKTLDDVKKILEDKNADNIDVPLNFLSELVDKEFLQQGTIDNITFQEYTKILKADCIKAVCKELKLRPTSKQTAIELLEEYSKTKSISSMFSNNKVNNTRRVLELMHKKVGSCYMLTELARSTLHKLYIIMYLGIDYNIIREKKLEFMLINEKIKRETFPIDDEFELDDASCVFESKDEFERYLAAHSIYEDYILSMDNDRKIAMVQQVFNLLTDTNEEHMTRYKLLPSWLQHYTPVYIYVKILEEGLQTLKKGKLEENCRFAVQILDKLIAGHFRTYHRAEWYAEKALILHSYLSLSTEAANTLIEGLESSIPDIEKQCMLPRAKLIAQQKNIQLEENLRQKLLSFAMKDSIREGNMKSKHFNKLPMENRNKGKALYETKSVNGREIQSVEEYAISMYLFENEFTKGFHWEGRLVTTIFFLLFWDEIYSQPKNAKGIYLSRFQRYPLDLFSDDFFLNRQEEFNKKLMLLQCCTEAEFIEQLKHGWDRRPEHELSGISRNVGWDNIREVCMCLGPGRVAILCERLATDYRYAHSGFPDLTLWDLATKKVRFVEVKSDNDKPFTKQLQWMQYMMDNNIETEFCYVGAKTHRQKSRQSEPKTPKVKTPKNKTPKATTSKAKSQKAKTSKANSPKATTSKASVTEL